jgi:hypothetical protein
MSYPRSQVHSSFELVGTPWIKCTARSFFGTAPSFENYVFFSLKIDWLIIMFPMVSIKMLIHFGYPATLPPDGF